MPDLLRGIFNRNFAGDGNSNNKGRKKGGNKCRRDVDIVRPRFQRLIDRSLPQSRGVGVREARKSESRGA